MEQQMSVMKNFSGDSYGNLDLQGDTVANDVDEKKKSDTEIIENDGKLDDGISAPSTQLIQDENKDKPHTLDTGETGKDEETEKDKKDGEGNIVQTEDQVNAVSLSKECTQDVMGEQDVKPEVADTDSLENGADGNMDENEDRTHGEDLQGNVFHQYSEEIVAADSAQNSPRNNTCHKSPRERLSIHITEGHGSDTESYDEDSDEAGDNVDEANSDNDARSLNERVGTDRTSAHSQQRPQTTSTMREVPGGLRAKANTPASQYTLNNELESPKDIKVQESGRGLSRESRDEVFQRAMTLMSNRCTSARGEDGALFWDKEPPFGVHIPQYFYVQQQRPQPMSPLKVWRGYKGNVYFEPINIQSVRPKSESSALESAILGRQQSSISTTRPNTRAPTRATTAGQSTRSYHYVNSSPQVYVMDKQAVIKTVNNNMPDELRFIEELESTGSLAVRPYSSNEAPLRSPRITDKRLMYKREKIRRGSNYHTSTNITTRSAKGNNARINSGKNSYNNSRFSHRKQVSYSAGPRTGSRSLGHVDPNLVVSGDKFAPPTVMSPLLRTASQFSRSGQRAAMNSPDILGVYDKLPTLEHVRVNIQHVHVDDDIPRIPYSQPAVYTKDVKPLIKHGPHVNTHHQRGNINFC